MMNFKEKYQGEILPALREKLKCANVMQVPRLVKIVVSTGIGSAKERSLFDEAKGHLSMICGQAPVVTKSKKNVANFKLRIGMPVGLMVTLRGGRMYDFLGRLVNITLPRVRDFRGVPSKGFDGSGNFNMGVQDISVFTEVDPDKLKNPMGINICFVTTAVDDAGAIELLRMFDFPFSTE